MTKIRRLTGDALKVSETPEVVIDDESNFSFSGSEMPANVSYYAGAGNTVPRTFKFQVPSKVPKETSGMGRHIPSRRDQTGHLPQQGRHRRQIISRRVPKVGTSAAPRFEVPSWRVYLLAGFGCSPLRTRDGRFCQPKRRCPQ